MRYHPVVGKGVKHPTGRIIALGRLVLAVLMAIAIWLDLSQPARAPVAGYALLAAYVAFAAAIATLTWNDWWRDAHLAGPAHAVDIVFFMGLVLLTAGYTSPFFTFYIFVLLSAAIRWSWHATALSAILLTLLYLIAGIVAASSGAAFDLQPFIIRTGHLIILSLLLIWFGASRWHGRLYRRDEEQLGHPTLGESPFETGLRAAMAGVGASRGAFVWRRSGEAGFNGLAIRGGELTEVATPRRAPASELASASLYDLEANRALRRDAKRNLASFAPLDLITEEAAADLSLSEGLALAVRSEEADGEIFLEGIPRLSTDHIDIGEQIAADIAAHIQRHALLKAAEESAEARSRLTLARDLHDSVVQFLAGAAFRLEAIKRSEASGRDVAPELNELKQLMLLEQQELRSFITALRSGPLVSHNDLALDLGALAARLSRQWDVNCEFSSRPADLMLPARLHLDVHQLMREAVANAVRHAEAKSVRVTLSAASDELRLEFVNDGGGLRSSGSSLDLPSSLKERVEQAGGALEMSRGMGRTKISVSLPVGEFP